MDAEPTRCAGTPVSQLKSGTLCGFRWLTQDVIDEVSLQKDAVNTDNAGALAGSAMVVRSCARHFSLQLVLQVVGEKNMFCTASTGLRIQVQLTCPRKTSSCPAGVSCRSARPKCMQWRSVASSSCDGQSVLCCSPFLMRSTSVLYSSHCNQLMHSPSP